MINENDRPKFKRVKFVVSPKFQLKYTGVILLFMFLTAVLCSYVVYYTTIIILGEKLANVYPQGRLVALINTVNFRIILSIILVTPFVAMIGIFLSHKIAGPLYRIERFLQNVGLGDFSSHITLRQGDELMTLADSINSLIDNLKTSIISQKDKMDRISIEADNLKRILETSPKDISVIKDSLKRLDVDARQLSRELNMFKL